MQRLTRHVSVIWMTNRRRLAGGSDLPAGTSTLGETCTPDIYRTMDLVIWSCHGNRVAVIFFGGIHILLYCTLYLIASIMNLAKITRLLCCIVDISECSYLCVKYLRYRFNVGYSCVGCFCIRLHFRSDIVLPWTTKVSQRSGNSAFPAVMSICGYIHAYLCISDRASITFISVNYLMLNSSFSSKQLCFACSSLQLL